MLLEHVAPLANCVEKSLFKGSHIYLKPCIEDMYWLHLLNLHEETLIVINLNKTIDEYGSLVLQGTELVIQKANMYIKFTSVGERGVIS
jgi:hypothetical protein